MFDIGFSEIMVIMVVALVVIGPERLPQVARTLGNLWGKLQRYMNQIKKEVASSADLADLRDAERKIKEQADELERSLQQVGREVDLEVVKVETDYKKLDKQPDKPGAQLNQS